jgi:type I restriction enzyme S subunit
MSAIIRLSPRAFVVWWKDVERWSVGSFVETGWRWPANVIRPLSAALTRKLVDVERDGQALPLVTLHFDGEMEPRNESAGQNFKGRLFHADPGDVIYSKIDVRNGAIGIIPEEMGRVCVSSEYPVYGVNSTIADARYVKLVFRTEAFRRKINSMISGASGRKRVQPSDLESVAVPLPPLPVQRKIVAAWEAARKYAAQTAAKIERLQRDIEARFLADLGLQAPEQVALPKAFAVRWKDLLRWSVTFNQLSRVAINLSGGTYPEVNLGSIAAVSYGIQKCPANRPGQYPRPYLRVANVQRGQLDLSEIKYIDVPDKEFAGLRLRPGDLVVCEGNSADLVGRPALWLGEIPDCVHQNHLLKVRADRSKAMPEYVLEYMNSVAARNYFRRRAKFTTNLASINSNDLRELSLPLPPLSVQEAMMKQVEAGRVEIARLKADAQARAEAATADVEAMILGIKPVEGFATREGDLQR